MSSRDIGSCPGSGLTGFFAISSDAFFVSPSSFFPYLIELPLLILRAQSFEQFSQLLVLELVVEVCSHMPNAPSAVNIRPLGCSVSFMATLFDAIHRLQNSFMPIVYDTHIWHILHHHLLQPLQKPVPTITILFPLQMQ
jgi:hypothetical protein